MVRLDNYQDFFLKPQLPRHKRYEVLRARFVEKKSMADIARLFTIPIYTVQTMIRDFRKELDNDNDIEFFITLAPGPKKDRKKSAVREHIIRLRARGYASTDIYKALRLAGFDLSLSLIDQLLREEGLVGMAKRSKQQREIVNEEIRLRQIPGLTIPTPATAQLPQIANVASLEINEERAIRTPHAGVFLFIPFLVQAGIDKIVQTSNMVGTKMIPPVSYLISLLCLKFLDKERKSHISDWDFDEGLGACGGLNILPKKTAITDYSYRLVQQQHNELLTQWMSNAYPILCPQGSLCFALDYHAIAHRGQENGLENNYVPTRGKATSSLLTFFARSIDAPMLCYANGDIIHEETGNMVSKFVTYWDTITGIKPDWLYFDSKLTTYAVLNSLTHDFSKKINFITIRKRGSALVRKLLELPHSQWKSAVIDTPQRRHQKIKYVDSKVMLTDYNGHCRQVAVKGLGRAAPTLFITNNEDISGREVVMRYTNRNSIENDIGINVNFFHMDCLASEVRLNVNLDLVTTVIANNCYRWLANTLKGCEKMEPKQLFRKFVDTPGMLSFPPNKVCVTFDRRSHNPVIAQAFSELEDVKIPWLQNRKLCFSFA